MKKTLKNAVSCTLAGIMALSTLPVSALAQETDKALAYEAAAAETEALPEEGMAEFEDRKDLVGYRWGDFRCWDLNEEEVEIVAYEGLDSNVTVPAEINGKQVTSIYEGAFDYEHQGVDESRIISITLPEGLTKIGDCAFSSCKYLKSINFPDSLSTIGKWAFDDCKSLNDITIPANVRFIGGEAFAGCEYLKEIKVAEDNLHFKSVDGVLYSVFPKSIHTYPRAKIGNSYAILDGTEQIYEGAFSNCKNLTSIKIPDSVTYIFKSAFTESSIISITIPEGVTSINIYMFDCCFNLTSITLPKSVSAICTGAFKDCDSLRTVNYAGTEEEWGKISIADDYNTDLLDAKINYNYVPVTKPYVTAYAGNSKTRLAWKAVDGATKYAIYTYVNGKYSLYKATTATAYNVTGLTNNKKYGFLVRAYVDGAWTSYTTNDIVYATPINKPVVTAYAGNGKVRLNWSKINGATKYAIYTYVNGKYTHYRNTTATAYNVTGLTNGTKYGFLVKAYVGGKWTTYNVYDRVSATPIDKPVITKTVAANGRVRLYWNKVDKATKYAIFTYSGGKYKLYKYTTANAYTVSGLKNGTAYGFLVRAYVNGKWTTYNVYDRVSATPKA